MKTSSFANRIWALVLVVMAILAVAVGSMRAQSQIHPISREDGSGTRGAFVELFNLQEERGNKKVQTISPKAEITNSTAVMLTSVAKDSGAIGYISLGSLNASVKALKIDGVEANVANVQSKKYSISRPFNIVTIKDNEIVKDFLGFILSQNAHAIIVKAGYIPVGNNTYKPSSKSGKITIAGSSSITPLMEKLKESYIKENPQVKIEIQQSDSTTGANATVQGIADMGMLSRELKESEIEKGLKPQVIAIDGLAVIVNPKNQLDNISPNQVKAIFEGKITKWSDVK